MNIYAYIDHELTVIVTHVVIYLLALLLIALLIGAVVLAMYYVVDKLQSEHAILRNYPIIGRFRYLFEDLGKFFRQYFFAMDREEMPFNREQRAWVYRAAKDLDTTVAFGSTKPHKTGNYIFANSPFPELASDTLPDMVMTVGPYCQHPYPSPLFFNISGMSYGAISKPAVQALSRGAARAGCWINTGEGGLSPYHLEGGGDIVFQIGTAKYGAQGKDGMIDYGRLAEIGAQGQVKMIELKLSQGAKPGKGGLLPAEKVNEEIAATRRIPPHVASISPNRHVEIDCPDTLLDMVSKVRDVSGRPTGFKFVLGNSLCLHDLFAAMVRRDVKEAPDFITIDSSDGGSGAAPMTFVDDVGMRINESLPIVVDELIRYGLRDRIRVIASGKMINPSEVAAGLCMGADFIVSARGFMFAIGCIQALQCNKNTCPTGVTTHNKRLQKGLVPADKARRVANYVKHLVKEVVMLANCCGLRSPRELQRHHLRVIGPDGISQRFDKSHPSPKSD